MKMTVGRKKIESFKRGLGTKLMKTMANPRCATYNEFVSDALTQENQNNLHAAAKGHKREAEVGASRSSSLELKWQPGHSFVHQRLSIGLLSQKLKPIALRRHSKGHSPLPYLRAMQAREA